MQQLTVWWLNISTCPYCHFLLPSPPRSTRSLMGQEILRQKFLQACGQSSSHQDFLTFLCMPVTCSADPKGLQRQPKPRTTLGGTIREASPCSPALFVYVVAMTVTSGFLRQHGRSKESVQCLVWFQSCSFSPTPWCLRNYQLMLDAPPLRVSSQDLPA